MAYTQKCDACGHTLNGIEAGHRQIDNCIEIKGQIISQDIDEDTGWREHTFISPDRNSALAFCNVDCFAEYIEMQKKKWQEKRIAQLKREAEEGIAGY